MTRDPQDDDSLDFLSRPPVPTSGTSSSSSREGTDDHLPQATINKLMALRGVDGVWIEMDASGVRHVVLHYSPPGVPSHLPATVDGMKTRIVGGERIRPQ